MGKIPPQLAKFLFKKGSKKAKKAGAKSKPFTKKKRPSKKSGK